MQKSIARLRDGSWLHAGVLIPYARVLLIFELAMLAFFVAGAHGLIVPLTRPNSTDFVSFYGAGILADVGTPWLAYDRGAHHAAEQQATQVGIAYNYFNYPPVFLLVCALLARLPYLVGFAAFQAATLLPALALARRIAPQASWLTLLAFPPVFWNAGTGQNAFLTGALFAGGLLALERRPILAGVLLGALCYKPHLGLLIPVALAAGGYWRTFIAAGVSATALVLLSLALFGVETWSAFLTAAAGSFAVYTGHAVYMGGLTSPFGAMLTFGAPVSAACIVQSAISVVLAGVVWTVWRRVASMPIRAAILLTATPIAVPVVMFYDLVLIGIGLAWLVREGLGKGFPPWHKTALAVLFVLPVLSGNMHGATPLPIAPMVAAGAFALALSAAWRATIRRG